jgi:cytochrome c556
MTFPRYIMSIALTIATLGGFGSALAHSGATGIVKERMDMFKRSQKNLKAIKSHIRAEDYGSLAKLADEIREWAIKMPEYFPEGSNIKPSEASPKIWEDFSGFKRAAMKNETATKRLIAAAEAGDQTAVVEGFKAVASSCKSCHQSYKLD